MSHFSNILRFLSRYPWVLCILGPGIIFLPMLMIGKVIYWGTPTLQFIPWQTYGWHLLFEGYWPTWNALNGLGAPLIANYQMAWYYPLNWILGIFYWIGGAAGIAVGYTFLTFFHFSWAGIGMQQFLSRIKLSVPAQVLGALAFQLTGYLVARTSFFSMIWTAAWMPWILLFVTKIEILNEVRLVNSVSNRKNLILLLSSLAMLLLAGHAQLAWYILLYSIIFSIVWAYSNWGCAILLRFLILFICIILLAAGVSAVQLLPTGEYLLNSQRSTAYAANQAFTYSFSPWRLIEFVFRGFFGAPESGNYWGYGSYWEDAIYIGVMPFVLALSSVKKTFKQGHSIKIFLWVMVAIGVILALGEHTPIFPFLYYHVPTFSMFQAPARYMIWAIFSLSVLASYGLSEWKTTTESNKYLKLSMVGAAAISLGTIGAIKLVPNLDGSIFKALQIGSALLAVSFYLLSKNLERASLKEGWWGWVIVFFTLLDLLFANVQSVPSTSSGIFRTSLMNPVALDRAYLSAEDEYQIKFNRLFRFADSRTIEPLSKQSLLLLPDTNLITNEGYITNFDPLIPARYHEWKTYVDELPIESKVRWLKFVGATSAIRYNPSTTNGISIDQISDSSLVHWIPCALSVSDDNAFLETRGVFSKELENQFVVVETAVPTAICDHSISQSAIILEASPVSFSIETNANSPGWLVLAETWYPGWKVSIDGKTTELFRADSFLMAVQVPGGKHAVKFWYQPTSTQVGTGISLLFIIVSVLIFWRFSRLDKNHVVQ